MLSTHLLPGDIRLKLESLQEPGLGIPKPASCLRCIYFT